MIPRGPLAPRHEKLGLLVKERGGWNSGPSGRSWRGLWRLRGGDEAEMQEGLEE